MADTADTADTAPTVDTVSMVHMAATVSAATLHSVDLEVVTALGSQVPPATEISFPWGLQVEYPPELLARQAPAPAPALAAAVHGHHRNFKLCLN